MKSESEKQMIIEALKAVRSRVETRRMANESILKGDSYNHNRLTGKIDAFDATIRDIDELINDYVNDYR